MDELCCVCCAFCIDMFNDGLEKRGKKPQSQEGTVASSASAHPPQAPVSNVMHSPEEEAEIIVTSTSERAPGANSLGISCGHDSSMHLEAQPEALAGSTIQVTWNGPTNDGDFIAIAKVGSPPTTYLNYAYVSKESPLSLLMPTKPGDYEIKYILEQNKSVLAKIRIHLLAPQASLEAQKEAKAGWTIQVKWSGPKNNGDYIAIAKVGSPWSSYLNYTYVSNGNPLDLLMPTEPGEYEIKYMLEQDNSVIAKTSIKLVAAQASLEAPEEATIGSTIPITWSGPENPGDFIAVSKVGSPSSSYMNYLYVSSGNPMNLLMPTKPGDYEIKYMLEQNNFVLAKTNIRLIPSQASLEAPVEAAIGSTISVTWSGPENAGDFVAIAEASSPPNAYMNYTYVNSGNPLNLLMPTKTGDYEIKYMLEQDNSVLATTNIRLLPAKASLEAPHEAIAGSTVQVNWKANENPGDYIAIARVGTSPDSYLDYTYVNAGNPLDLVMPTEPGDYEIKYMLEQGNTVITKQSIRIV